MDKHPVTRTISIGAISGGVQRSDEVSSARRHSSAGIRALLWATGSTKSFGCSTDSQTSRENIFSNILTPDSIPQFTIPSLSVQTSLRSLDRDTEDIRSEADLRSSGTETAVSPTCNTISSSSSSSCSSLVLSNRKAERCVSDPLTKRRSLLPSLCRDTQHYLDPESKAALSLPHLPKVTTPYGFVTLSQSPHMVSEEALLCQPGLRRLKSDNTASCSAEGIRGNCFHLMVTKKKQSKDSAALQSTENSARGQPQTSISPSVSSSSTTRNPDKLKRRFYHVIKKHFM